MADISSINLNGNSYNIKDNNAVSKSGDTMTGTLDIKSTSIDSSATPSTTQFLTMVRGLDENGVTNSNIRMFYSNNGNETLQLVVHRVVNGVDKYNNFSIGLDASGNPIFYTDNQSEFCNAINAVNKSGDTMTGILDTTSMIRIHNNSITYGTAPSSDVWGNSLWFADKDNNYAGVTRVVYRKTGENQLHISAMQKSGNSTIENYLRLGVDTNGTKSISVADASAWRNAINAVNKSGDTMTGDLIISGESKVLRFVPTDTSKMSYAQIYVRDNERFAFWQRTSNGNGNELYLLPVINTSATGNNYYDILTSKNTVTVAQGGTGKTTHTANAVLTGNGTSAVNNVATASGAFYATKANGAPSFGTLPVAQGGTGVATLTSGAALIGNGTNDVTTRSITNNTSKNYITANTNLITANTLGYWNGAYNNSGSSNISYLGTISKGTWQGSAIDLNYGGTGGTDSGWQPYENSDKFTGTIYYRKVGVFFEIQAQQINLKNTLTAGGSVLLMTVPSTYKPAKEIMPSCFINSSLVQNRIAPMRLAYNGQLYLYANKTDAIESSYNLYFSGFGFM